MRSLFGALFAVASVAAVSAPLAAQSFSLSANVPFEFHVGAKMLPAGEYALRNANDGALIALRSAESGASVMALTLSERHPGSEAGMAWLTFRRYGDTYYLSSIWDGSTGFSRILPVTRDEAELRRTASVQQFVVLARFARR